MVMKSKNVGYIHETKNGEAEHTTMGNHHCINVGRNRGENKTYAKPEDRQ